MDHLRILTLKISNYMEPYTGAFPDTTGEGAEVTALTLQVILFLFKTDEGITEAMIRKFPW
jgi:hypothetical protein